MLCRLGLPDLSLPSRSLIQGTSQARCGVVTTPRGNPRGDKPEPLNGGRSHTTQVSLSCHFTKHARLCLGRQSLHLLPHCGLLMDVPEHPGYGMFPGMASPRASELVSHSAQLSSPACSISTHHDTNLCKTLFLL